MARAIVSQRPERLASHSQVRSTSPDVARQFVVLWEEPKGLDSYRPPSKIDPNFCEDSVNLLFERGQYQSRLGTRLIGNAAASTVLQSTDLVRANGKKVTIRFCLRHVEVFNYLTGAWRSFPVDLHGDEDDLFTWTSWADKLLFSNGVDGIWELDFTTYIITQVDGAPSAKHLTVFGGRVIATAADGLPYRIQWSVKNDYTKWSQADGGGFEDLFGAPGGLVDEALATIPITDEAAFVLRSQSIWQMSLSGIAIAPFRFSRVIRVGCNSRHSIVETPRGIVFTNSKSVYLINVGVFVDLGRYVIQRMIDNFADCKKTYAIYDVTRDEYRICNCNVVFRYRWDNEGWTKDLYQFQLKSLGNQFSGKTGYPIDSLQGTIDELVGTIDDLVIDRPDDDKILLTPSDSLVTLREHDSGDAAQDQLEDGSLVDSSMEIVSGVVNLNRLEASEILEAHVEYEANEDQTIDFDFMPDDGSSFTFITSKSVNVTSGTEMLRVKLAQTSRKLKFRVRSDTLGKFRLLSLTSAAVMVHRAR